MPSMLDSVAPMYVIYRDAESGTPYDPAAPPVFYPPRDSDELFDALRYKYPDVVTHSERMRNAMIEFYIAERNAEAAAYTQVLSQSVSDSASPWTGQSWPSMSSAFFSSPDTSAMGTPQPATHSRRTASPASDQSKAPSPMPIDSMTSVFSLSTTTQPKQRLRRKMTDAEKTDYRHRRLLKACDKCAKRKRKCTHTQLPAKPAKSSDPAPCQHENAVAADNGTHRQPRPHNDKQASGTIGSTPTDAPLNDFTLIFDDPMPDVALYDMFNDYETNDFHFFNSPSQLERRCQLPSDTTKASNCTCDTTPDYLNEPGLPQFISPILLDARSDIKSQRDGESAPPFITSSDIEPRSHINGQRGGRSSPEYTTTPDSASWSHSQSQAHGESPKLCTGMLNEKEAGAVSTCPVADLLVPSVSTATTSVLSKISSLDRRPSPCVELFKLRRRISPTNTSEHHVFARNTFLPVNTATVQARQPDQGPTCLHASSDILPLGTPQIRQNHLLGMIPFASSSTAGSMEIIHSARLQQVQHVGRLMDHVRYRDHHGRSTLGAVLAVCCSIVALSWLCSSSVAVMTLGAAVLGWIGVRACSDRLNMSDTTSSLHQGLRKRVSMPFLNVGLQLAREGFVRSWINSLAVI